MNKNKAKDRKTAGIIRGGVVFFAFLMYWELLVFDRINGGLADFTKWIVLYIAAIALVFGALSQIFTRSTFYKIWFFVLTAALSAYYVIQYVYFRIFGSLISVVNIGLGGDAAKDFSWTMTDIIIDNILDILLILLPALITLALIFVKKFKPKGAGLISAAAMLLCGVLVWTGVTMCLPLEGKEDFTVYGAYHSQFVDTDTASKKLGALADTIVEAKMQLFGTSESGFEEGKGDQPDPFENLPEVKPKNVYSGLSFGDLEEQAEDEKIKSLCHYLSTDNGTRQNEYTGLFKDYNVIFICAESFSTGAIDPNVTPTLYRLAGGGIVLNNFYNSFPNTTTNGEFAMLTGIWPDVSRSAMLGKTTGSMPQSISNNMSTALGNMLNRARGVQSLGFHNYKGYYYDREHSLPNMGFQCKFMNAGMEFSTAWPSSDKEMMEQSVSDYVNSDKPFCAYYMTFSGHGTYLEGNCIREKNIEEVRALTAGRNLDEAAEGYLACNLELEKGLSYLMDQLEQAGKLEKTLIVITGDHFPYYLNNYAYKQLFGRKVDEDFEKFRSSCIMWAGSHEQDPIIVDDYCCNVDILPTVLNLLGIEYDSRLYAGRDIFAETQHAAILYNKNFITDKVKYNNETGEVIWLVERTEENAQELDDYLDSLKTMVKNRYQASINMMDCNFYEFVFNNVSAGE